MKYRAFISIDPFDYPTLQVHLRFDEAADNFIHNTASGGAAINEIFISKGRWAYKVDSNEMQWVFYNDLHQNENELDNP